MKKRTDKPEQPPEDIQIVKKGKEAPSKPKEKRILDSLARLLEMTSQGCTAICVIKNKILIADNDIDASTNEDRSRNHKVDLIIEVFEYFSKFIAKDTSNAMRLAVFEKICIRRAKGEKNGYITLDENKIKDIAGDVLGNYKGWRETYQKKVNSNIYALNQLKEVAVTYELCNLLARDFIKLEKFINNSLTDNAFVKALKSNEINWIRTGTEDEMSYKEYSLIHDDKYSCLILAIGKHLNSEKVHAETKVLDYLIFTRMLQNLPEPLYIGISKLCCRGCSLSIQLCNEYINTTKKKSESDKISITEYIEKRDDHNIKFAKWGFPIFLYDQKDLLRNSKDNVGYYKDDKNEICYLKDYKDVESKAKDFLDKVYLYTDMNVIRVIQELPTVKLIKEKLRKSREEVDQEKVAMQEYSPSSAESIEEEGTEQLLKNVTNDAIFHELTERYKSLEQVRLIKSMQEQLEQLNKKRKEPVLNPEDTLEIVEAIPSEVIPNVSTSLSWVEKSMLQQSKDASQKK